MVCPDRPAFDEFERNGPALHRFRAGDAADLARVLDAALTGGDGGGVDRLASLVGAEYTWDAVGARVAMRIRELVGR